MDRRRHGRYHTEGHVEVQVLRDVDIVRASAREITVISRARAVTGSEMRMRVTAAGGRQATLRVRTTGSQPQLVGGQLRYRLWMQVLSQEPEVTWWTWPGLRGAVLEQIPGRLLDIGAGGCSLETPTRLASGTFGFVEVQSADASIAEVARVCDVTERPGAAAPFLVRLEFLPIALPAGLGVGDRRTPMPEGSLAAAAEKAGHSLTLVRRRRGDGAAENVSSAHSAPDSHGCAEPEPPREPLAERLKK